MGRARQRPLRVGLVLAALITILYPGSGLLGSTAAPASPVGGTWVTESASPPATSQTATAEDPPHLPRSTQPGAADPDAPAMAMASVPLRTPGLPTATAGTSTPTPTPTPAVALPEGHANVVVALLGGSRNAYWVRVAEYAFAAGAPGRVHQSYWAWSESTFSGNASVNKVATGYLTAGCAVTCAIRAPVGFQPGASPRSLDGTYAFDSRGHLAIHWRDGRSEAWALGAHGTSTQLALFSSTFDALVGDASGSNWSFSSGASRDTIAGRRVTGTQRSAVFCSLGNAACHDGYVAPSSWDVDLGHDYTACPGSACLFLYHPTVWRSYWAIDPSAVGRRVYWENELEGVDHDWGACFSLGGGHTWALLQALDDQGAFLGFIGVEASLNARTDANAVVSEVFLKPVA